MLILILQAYHSCPLPFIHFLTQRVISTHLTLADISNLDIERIKPVQNNSKWVIKFKDGAKIRDINFGSNTIHIFLQNPVL